VSSDGENILKAFQQVKRICEDISLLLQTVEKEMARKEWNNATGSTAIADGGRRLLDPSRWIPIYVFRFYKHKNFRNRLAFVSVLLDDHWEKFYSLKEPLVTAGYFDFERNEATLDGNYWYARYYGYMLKENNLEPNGIPFSFETVKMKASIQGKFKRGEVFGLPLTSIKNANDVKELITDKLLERAVRV